MQPGININLPQLLPSLPLFLSPRSDEQNALDGESPRMTDLNEESVTNRSSKTGAEGTTKELSADFLAYCAREGIDSASCFENVGQVPRFVRVNPRSIESLLRRLEPQQDGNPCSTGEGSPTVVERLTRVLGQELRKVSSDVRVEPIDWVPPEFLAFQITPRTFPLSTCWLYSERHLYGMDAGSMCTVAALGAIRKTDDVLDLCCAPGMKLALISDTREGGNGNATSAVDGAEADDGIVSGTAVGVDVSLSRLFTTRSILRKYMVPRVSLFLCDGRVFHPDRAEESLRRNHGGGGNRAALDRHLHRLGKRLRTADEASMPPQGSDSAGTSSTSLSSLEGHHGWLGKVNPALRVPTFVFQSESDPSPAAPEGTKGGDGVRSHSLVIPKLYDKVLVDVECTHDGSISHLPTAVESSTGPNKYKTGKMRHLGATVSCQPTVKREGDAVLQPQPEEEVPRDEPDVAESSSGLDLSDYGALLQLQENLLERGFSLLKPGGILVYSTCSFSESQNEGIIRSFLSRHENPSGLQTSKQEVNDQSKEGVGHSPNCIPQVERLLFAPGGADESPRPPAVEGEQIPSWCRRLSTRTTPGLGLPEAVRLTPKESGTSFQFICRIRKVPCPQ